MKKTLLTCMILSAFALSAVNIADYGAGPMKKPGRTFYVSTKGNNKNDGSSLKKAFRTIEYGAGKLRAGDTLLIEGGEYFEREIKLNVKEGVVGYSQQCGRPGSPIRIMGMKGQKAVLKGGIELKRPARKDGTVYKFPYRGTMRKKLVWELPSNIELQHVPSEKVVREYPGTFFHDEKNKQIIVHFAALDQKGISLFNRRVGVRIQGSYIHIENLNFSHYSEPIYARMNRPYDKNKASCITIRNCNFFWNSHAGIVIDGASRSLIQNNRGAYNTTRGNILNLSRAKDNLIIGNWSGPTWRTQRHLLKNGTNFGINSYGGNPPRNHVVANFIESERAFRWKGAGAGNIFSDNIVLGTFHVESKAMPVTIKNNLFSKLISWGGVCGYKGWEKDFKNTPIKFYSNTLKAAEFRSKHPELLKAKALKIKLPEIRFPAVEFKDLRADYITNDSAVILWRTPDCDGVPSVGITQAGQKKTYYHTSGLQGVDHAVGITGLKPETEYIVRAFFQNRRGGKTARSKTFRFKTAAALRAPKTLEVGPGKLTLEQAACAAVAGDTIKLLPGVHHGRFIPVRSGLPGKPITLTGQGKAVIDALGFYSHSIIIRRKSHIVIDGITFANPDTTIRKGIIFTEGGSHITVQNCRVKMDWISGNFVTFRATPHSVARNNIIWGGDYPITVVGGNVRILNNTIVDATMLTVSLWDPHNIEIRDNIFYRPCIESKKNPALLLHNPGKNIVSEGNVYWSPLKYHPMGGRIRNAKSKVLHSSTTLEEWRKMSGLDKTSIHADPMFVDYKKGDFRLRPGSPAKGKGASL